MVQLSNSYMTTGKTIGLTIWTFLSKWRSLLFNMLPRFGASLVAQMVKHMPAMWETQVRSLGQEDPLEKEMATQSSILTWEIPWTEEPGGLQFRALQRVDSLEKTLLLGKIEGRRGQQRMRWLDGWHH